MNTDTDIEGYLRRMGEPPSSVDYLMRTIYFNGEPVTVQRPNWVSNDEE